MLDEWINDFLARVYQGIDLEVDKPKINEEFGVDNLSAIRAVGEHRFESQSLGQYDIHGGQR
ncbi:hypothetical protein J4429_04125 [Candidatus Pacearchaeota archaeon]|nr:hypothetical protein [Candidatus Pacearchaeota archaeon]